MVPILKQNFHIRNFLVWKLQLLIQTSVIFAPIGQINNKAALVLIMDLYRDKPLPEPVMIQFFDAFMLCPASLC